MLGIHHGKLSPCPTSPNCVCSDSTNKKHYIEPYQLKVKPGKGWEVFKEVISALPRITIISATNYYLHAEARSRIFRFVDDLEFQLHPQQNIIAIRSAARLGYYDLGVNRHRLEKMRSKLRSRGII